MDGSPRRSPVCASSSGSSHFSVPVLLFFFSFLNSFSCRPTLLRSTRGENRRASFKMAVLAAVARYAMWGKKNKNREAVICCTSLGNSSHYYFTKYSVRSGFLKQRSIFATSSFNCRSSRSTDSMVHYSCSLRITVTVRHSPGYSAEPRQVVRGGSVFVTSS